MRLAGAFGEHSESVCNYDCIRSPARLCLPRGRPALAYSKGAAFRTAPPAVLILISKFLDTGASGLAAGVTKLAVSEFRA